MYTITIIILLIISIFYLICDRKYINWYILSLFVIICSCYSYIEFYFCNNFDMVPAWIFGKNAIIGISIFTIPIEDIFFTPIFAVFFYALYQVFPKERDIAEKYELALFALLILLMGLSFFLFSGTFGRYSSIRLFIIITLLSKYCRIKLNEMIIFCLMIIIFAFLWDLWALNTNQWQYREFLTGINSNVFNNSKWNWLLIYHAWFPLEIFFYYLNGSIFGYLILNFLSNYIQEKRKINY